MRPERIFRRVVFPAPFGPKRPRISPSPTSRLTSRSAQVNRGFFTEPGIHWASVFRRRKTLLRAWISTGGIMTELALSSDPRRLMLSIGMENCQPDSKSFDMPVEYRLSYSPVTKFRPCLEEIPHDGSGRYYPLALPISPVSGKGARPASRTAFDPARLRAGS